MTTHPRVPADVDPDSILDLVEDCREVSGVLAPYLSLDTVLRLPDARTALPIEIDVTVAAGYGDY